MKKLLFALCCMVSMTCFGQKKTDSSSLATTRAGSEKPSNITTVTTSSGATATSVSFVYSPGGFKTVTLVGGPKGRKFKNGVYSSDGKICVRAAYDGYGNVAVAPGTEIIADDAIPTSVGGSKVYIPSTVKYIGKNEYFTAKMIENFKIIEDSSDADE